MLQREEVAQAVAGICKAFLMTPPEREKLDALMDKADKNHDGVLSREESKEWFSTMAKELSKPEGKKDEL